MFEVKLNIDVVLATTFSWTNDLIQLIKLIQKWIENSKLKLKWVDKKTAYMKMYCRIESFSDISAKILWSA